MRTNSILGYSGLLVAGIALPQAVEADGAKDGKVRPNVIFILADDMGYGDLSCYGSDYVKTPNIDRLAATGTRFTQCYAGSAISSPSRCSLMTGRSSGNTRIRDNQCKAGGLTGLKISPKGDTTIVRRANLLPQDTTIATVLSAAGYRTCLVNKWHLDGYDPTASPNHRGFDEFYGWTISTVHSNSPYYYPYYRFDNDSLITIPENEHDRHVRHNTDISTDDAISFVRRNQHRPFFLYLAFDAPHEPYIIDNTVWYDDETWDMNTKRYAALITHMDAAIGRLMDELERLGLRENTMVIFASDNGAAVQAPLKELNCNAGFRGRKGQLYEGGIRVPFIVNQPGRVPVQKLDNTIYFPDVMPTLAALTGAGAYLPQKGEGINILPLFYGQQVDTDNRTLYWEFPGVQRAARRGDWKCVTIKRGAPLELYNIKDDPAELHNLASEYPEKVAEFEHEMSRLRTPSVNWPLPGEPKTLEFTTVKANPITPVKNQSRSGTCWDYATLGFFEGEILRQTGRTYDLCEMFVANKNYADEAVYYVRMHGDTRFSEGGSADDVLAVLRNHGVCPEEAMPAPGTLTGDSLANFTEFFNLLTPYAEASAKNKAKRLSRQWLVGYQAILDAYLGRCPEQFVYEGKTYTPRSFADSFGLCWDDYISLTSYTHHPFNTWFTIEAPYKWRPRLSYNVPLDTLMSYIDTALDRGYNVCWGGDVSGNGFTRQGLAQEETLPTQEERQQRFDSWDATYDHVMLIYGKARDQYGNDYYMVKNSWGEAGEHQGIWYMRKNYIALNTTYIFLNRHAIDL